MTLLQSNLTFDEAERLAYITGQTLPHDMGEAEEAAEALEYREIATDYLGINSAEDLKTRLDELYDLEAALPDNCSDAADLKKWASEAEDITTERDNLRESLAAVSLVLKKKKGQLTRAQIKELVEWLDYAVNETGPGTGIDERRLADDLGVDL